MKTIVLSLLGLTEVSAYGLDASPRWIAGKSDAACPVNTFTYLREVVHFKTLNQDLSLQIAADSNAHLWINGHLLRSKVPRYFERKITPKASMRARPCVWVTTRWSSCFTAGVPS